MNIVLKHCDDVSKIIMSKDAVDRFYMINKTRCIASYEISGILSLYNLENDIMHKYRNVILESCILLGTKGTTCICQTSTSVCAGDDCSRIKTSIIEFNAFTNVITNEINLVGDIFTNKCITIDNYIYCINGYMYDINNSKIYYITNLPECDDFRMHGKKLYATNTKCEEDWYDISPKNITFHKSGECTLKKTFVCDRTFKNRYFDGKLYVLHYAGYLTIYKVRKGDENTVDYLTRCKMNIQPTEITSICKVKNRIILCCGKRMYQIQINKNTDIHDAEIALGTTAVIKDELFDRAATQEWC